MALVPSAPKLPHPAGHNVIAELIVRPVAVIGSTALTFVAAYVLAEESLLKIFNGDPSINDIIVVLIVAALGVMVDTAILIFGSRFAMYAQRKHPSERIWKRISLLMLLLCIGVEAMTLAYFFYLITPTSVPDWAHQTIEQIHGVLFFIRAGMPPLIIVMFSVAVRDLVFSRSDRKFQMQSHTSARLIALEKALADPDNQNDKAELLQRYATQLRLYAYASDATQEEREEDKQLLGDFRGIWSIDGDEAQLKAALLAAEAQVQAAQNTAEAERQRLVLEAESAVKTAQKDFAMRLLNSLLFLANRGELPPDILAEYPQLADLEWGKGGAKARPKATASPVKIPTLTDRLRELLEAKGVEILGQEGRDYWVKTAAIEQLTEGEISGEKATMLARSLAEIPGKPGEYTKAGLAYKFLVRGLLSELYDRKALKEPLRLWEERRRNRGRDAAGSTGETGEFPVIVPGMALPDGIPSMAE